MINKLKLIHEEYKDVIPYLFFGVCTTLVNVVTYWFAVYILHNEIMISTIAAWILAVLFAYITNRKYVFKSSIKGFYGVFNEFSKFIVSRLATGLVDWLCMFIFVQLLGINDLVIKVCANVLVIGLNYIASKMLVFSKGIHKEK